MVLSGREVVGIAPQTLVATPVAPTILVPVLPGTFRASENFEQILDQGRRGIDALDFRALQGVGHTEITWEGLLQQGVEGTGEPKAVIGYLLANLFGADGSSDVVGALTTYDHRLKLGTTKAYLTVEHDSGGIAGANDRRFSACRVTEVSIRWNAGEGYATYSVTLIGRSPSSVTAQVLTDLSNNSWMGWHCRATVAGSTNTRVISGEWTLRRSPLRFYGLNNTQDFTDLYLGPLEVTCSLTLDYSIITDLTAFRSKTQGQLSTEFVVGSPNAQAERSFRIGGSNFDLGDGPAELDNSGENVRLGVVARGLYTTSSGPFSSTGNAATAQNGPVEVQIIQLPTAIYDVAP